MAESELQDPEIVRRVLDGDTELFGVLVDRYRGKVPMTMAELKRALRTLGSTAAGVWPPGSSCFAGPCCWPCATGVPT